MFPRLRRFLRQLLPIKAVAAVGFPSTVILSAMVGGVSGTAVMMVLIIGSQMAQNGNSAAPTIMLLGIAFIPLIVVYRWARRVMMETSLTAVETTLYRIRTRVVRKLSRLDLRDIETISRESIIGAVLHACDAISEAILPTIFALQSLVMIVLGFAYLTYLSPIGLICAVIGMTYVAWVFSRQIDVLRETTAGIVQAGVSLSTGIAEFTSGFKELRLDRIKQAAVLFELRAASMTAARQRSRSAGAYTEVMTEASSSEYIIAAAVVFVVPALSSADNTNLPAVLAAVLFLTAPFSAMANTVPRMTALGYAVRELIDFENMIDALLRSAGASGGADGASSTTAPATARLARVRVQLQAVSYEHRAPNQVNGFRVGPLDFEVSSGEIVFITGSNGAGKTTALRLITGLYQPRRGHIILNEAPLALDDVESYRHLFGTVFADFHVFRKPYALTADQMVVFRDGLHWLGIADKLPQDLEGGYDTTALSTGQRKRLALAITVAEDRPIFVFDEWAADQDPEFRTKFYHEILPRFRDAGKAIIAITHDDRYFDMADRRYHMADRRLSIAQSA